MDLKIRSLIEEKRDYMISIRRELHRCPETAGREERTREILMRELNAMGVPFEKVEGTGLIARVTGRIPGNTRLLRADMDGLPVIEEPENLRGPKACVSEMPGRCHACGHDAHMAMLLGAVKVLMDLRDRLKGTVLCCFEEGEEENTGVENMLSALEKYPVESCFALHVYAGLDAGKLDISPGPRMAGMVGIGFHVIGKAGHGSRPDQAVNPIIPAAHIVTQLDAAFNNQLSARETITLGMCVFRAGEAYNVIPETAYISGTARYFCPDEGEKALAIVRRTAENTADSFLCKVRFAANNRIILPPAVNDPMTAAKVRRGVEKMFSPEVIGNCETWFASESFSLYMKKYPGALGLLGIRNEALGSGAPHHNGRFDIDESVMPLGVGAHIAFALEEE